jgi:hypothetical protein
MYGRSPRACVLRYLLATLWADNYRAESGCRRWSPLGVLSIGEFWDSSRGAARNLPFGPSRRP